jgi:hypothetical protein
MWIHWSHLPPPPLQSGDVHIFNIMQTKVPDTVPTPHLYEQCLPHGCRWGLSGLWLSHHSLVTLPSCVAFHHPGNQTNTLVHHGMASACNTPATQKQIPYTLRHGITQLIFVTDQLPYLLMYHMCLYLKISIKKRVHISQWDFHFWTLTFVNH